MELFFSRDIDGTLCRLDADESAHCVKVLRHREGDDIHVIDGEGTLYSCRILSASPKEVEAEITGVERDWGAHPYRLRMAVCPTKNTDRYEWFAEKATELGVDVITPVIGDHSERKVFKTERLKRILLSASKQSLKGAVPQVDEALPLRDLIRSYAPVLPSQEESALPLCGEALSEAKASSDAPRRPCETEGRERQSGGSQLYRAEGGTVLRDSTLTEGPDNPTVILNETKTLPLQPERRILKLICCCYEGEEKRVSIGEVLAENQASEIVILIGPEGDFSREEVALALECGFRPVHLGPSRLRTETAALAAVAAVYFHYCGDKGM